MHKPEAARLFLLLGDEDRVKIIKMLYIRKELTKDILLMMIGSEEDKLTKDLSLLKESQLIISNDDFNYSINKELVDELMEFVRTPCGCASKY